VLITLVAESSCGGQPEIRRGNEATAVLPTTPASFSFCRTKERPVFVETLDESSLPEPTTSAGFLAVRGNAKLFYSFVRTEGTPNHSPPFLFFNGGPGAGTTGGLRACGTAPTTIDFAVAQVIRNQFSWSKMRNLLYVDSRQSGFYYSQTRLGERETGALRDFTAIDDATDFVRALLGYYEKFPVLSDNPVIVVGESYGGIRTQLILKLLRNQKFVEHFDGELAAAIKIHGDRVSERWAKSGLGKNGTDGVV
jgi:hypothetical protein